METTKYMSFSLTDDGVTHNVDAEYGDFTTWPRILYDVLNCLGAAYGYDISSSIKIKGHPVEEAAFNPKYNLLDRLEKQEEEEPNYYMGTAADWEDE